MGGKKGFGKVKWLDSAHWRIQEPLSALSSKGLSQFFHFNTGCANVMGEPTGGNFVVAVVVVYVFMYTYVF